MSPSYNILCLQSLPKGGKRRHHQTHRHIQPQFNICIQKNCLVFSWIKCVKGRTITFRIITCFSWHDTDKITDNFTYYSKNNFLTTTCTLHFTNPFLLVGVHFQFCCSIENLPWKCNLCLELDLQFWRARKDHKTRQEHEGLLVCFKKERLSNQSPGYVFGC